jgi:uncharacterized protein (TIGR02001 family)
MQCRASIRRFRPIRCGVALVFLLCCGVVSAGEFSAAISASSDYVEHGLSRSRGDSVVRVHGAWALPHGFTVAAALGTLDLNPGRGPAHEIGLYLGKQWALTDDWSLRLETARYEFGPNARRGSYDYSELTTSISYRRWLSASIGYSPDYSLFSRRGAASERAALNYAVTVRYPVRHGITLITGAGHYELSDLFGTGFSYWNAGAQVDLRRASFALSFIGTDNTAVALFGNETAGERLSATVAIRLQ